MTLIADISRDELVAHLRALEAPLRKRGVTGLAVFGSRARGDARPDSDLDLLVEVDDRVGNPLYVAFDVQHIVHETLGVETQATLRSDLNPRIADRIADDILKVF